MNHTAYGTFAIGGDLEVDRLGFGAMRLARNGMDTAARDPETARAVLRRAAELGVDHIDTADFYRSADGAVRANDLIRQALHPYPQNLVIATKVGPIFGPDGPTQGTAADLRPAVEANLAALGTGRLDLVYLRIGWRTPPAGESLAERFEVLAALRDEGLIRHLGLSNVDQAHLSEAQAIAPVAAIQNLFDPADPAEAALADRAAKEQIAFVPFGGLGSGHGSTRDEAYAAVARRHGATVAQVALAHALALAPNVLAIPGTGSVAHLEENIAARSLTLTTGDLATLS
jgi:pyridoxine 4-dehydrogenase